jgi:hypothetical protein
MKQFTKEQAVSIAKSGEWKDWTDEEVVRFQLYQRRLCMDFSRYHKALGVVLGRSVFSHEIMDTERLQEEYEGKRPAPTFDEIMNMIPAEKRIMVEL